MELVARFFLSFDSFRLSVPEALTELTRDGPLGIALNSSRVGSEAKAGFHPRRATRTRHFGSKALGCWAILYPGRRAA
jgi:hypothetical protein